MPSKKISLGRWHLLDLSTVIPFVPLTEKRCLTEIVELAQLAILSPGINPQRVTEGVSRVIRSRSAQIKFLPNVVVGNITGQGLPNPSVFDLRAAMSIYNDNNPLLAFIAEPDALGLGNEREPLVSFRPAAIWSNETDDDQVTAGRRLFFEDIGGGRLYPVATTGMFT